MQYPPLIERELRVALRRKRPVRRRVVAAAWGVGAAVLCLLLAWLLPGAVTGKLLHQGLCVAGAILALRVIPAAAGALAAERAAGTLGLMFLGGLTPGRILAGKALSTGLVTGTELLTLFPLLAIPFLMGGVSFELFVSTALTLPLCFVFILSATLLASVLTDDEGEAMVLTWVGVGAICLTPPVIQALRLHFSGPLADPWWLRLSPARTPWLLYHGMTPRGEITAGLGFSLAWSLLFMIGAGALLKRLVRETDRAPAEPGWRERWRTLVHGGRDRRRALAVQWLDGNPCVWLAARDRRQEFTAWAVLAGVTALWTAGWLVWGAHWASVASVLLTVSILNASLAWIFHHAAAASLAGARHDGTFELLLTTPLQTTDVVWGGLEALQCQFRRVGTALLAADSALFLAGLGGRSWTRGALFVYGVVAAWLLYWAFRVSRGWRGLLPSMWAGLNSARPAYAIWKLSGNFSWWTWFQLWNVRHLFGALVPFPTGSLGELIFAWAALVVLILMAVIKGQRGWGENLPDKLEGRLFGELREIAREPIPPNDHPGFKKWNPRERYPWGWDVVQGQLHERLGRGLAGR